MQETGIRNNWTLEEITSIYNLPLLQLINRAANVHHRYNQTGEVQVCTLLSIKTGGCPEDCAYCPQAARYHTDVSVHPLMQQEEVLSYAQKAKNAGSTRFCMGAAWRGPKEHELAPVLEMVKGVRALGLETCATLGMLQPGQAAQ